MGVYADDYSRGYREGNDDYSRGYRDGFSKGQEPSDSWYWWPRKYTNPVSIGGANPNPLPRPIAMIAAEPDPTEADFPAPIPVELL